MMLICFVVGGECDCVVLAGWIMVWEIAVGNLEEYCQVFIFCLAG